MTEKTEKGRLIPATSARTFWNTTANSKKRFETATNGWMVSVRNH